MLWRRYGGRYCGIGGGGGGGVRGGGWVGGRKRLVIMEGGRGGRWILGIGESIIGWNGGGKERVSLGKDAKVRSACI